MEIDKYTFDIIDTISKQHSNKVFGYFDKDDLKNEIWTICLEKLKDFNGKRGELEHFLRVSVRNRLINKFKDVTKIVKSPCLNCPMYCPGKEIDCKEFGLNKHQCDKYNNYKLHVESRNSLLNVTEPKFEPFQSGDFLDKIAANEIIEKIKPLIPNEHRLDFNNFISGNLSRKKISKLKKIILKILKENNIYGG